MGYRNLIESSSYRSLLDDLNTSTHIEPVEEKLRRVIPADEKELTSDFSNWSLSDSFNKYSYLNDSSNSLNSSFGSTIPKPVPMPRSQDPYISPPQTLDLGGRQRYNSGSSNSVSKTSADDSFNLTASPNFNKLTTSLDFSTSTVFPQSPIKPIANVHPFPVPRVKASPPPIPEKPKNLQTARLKSIEIADKSNSSINELDVNPSFSKLDNETLLRMEEQRIAVRFII